MSARWIPRVCLDEEDERCAGLLPTSPPPACAEEGRKPGRREQQKKKKKTNCVLHVAKIKHIAIAVAWLVFLGMLGFALLCLVCVKRTRVDSCQGAFPRFFLSAAHEGRCWRLMAVFPPNSWESHFWPLSLRRRILSSPSDVMVAALRFR